VFLALCFDEVVPRHGEKWEVCDEWERMAYEENGTNPYFLQSWCKSVWGQCVPGERARALHFRIRPAAAPPIRAIIFVNLPIFFIICCIWANLFSIVLSSVTLTPLPLAMR